MCRSFRRCVPVCYFSHFIIRDFSGRLYDWNHSTSRRDIAYMTLSRKLNKYRLCHGHFNRIHGYLLLMVTSKITTKNQQIRCNTDRRLIISSAVYLSPRTKIARNGENEMNDKYRSEKNVSNEDKKRKLKIHSHILYTTNMKRKKNVMQMNSVDIM